MLLRTNQTASQMLLRTNRMFARRACNAAARALVHEVAPRDGLQNEAAVLSTSVKLELIRRLVASSPSSVEVTSFVRADVIPALADADELCAALWQQDWAVDARDRGMSFAGLVLNQRGFERFARAQLDTATVIISCTESHSKANSNKGFRDALELTCKMIETGAAEGITMRGYASMAFGCPFETVTDPARVQDAVVAMIEAGASTIILADTIGVGYPSQVRTLGEAALRVVPAERLGLHMHDTYGRAVENCIEGTRAPTSTNRRKCAASREMMGTRVNVTRG